MPRFPQSANDRTLELSRKVYELYGIRIGPVQATILRYLMDVSQASGDAVDHYVWPEDDPFDADIAARRRTHISDIKKKFGPLIDLLIFPQQGYRLRRLGPPDNPLHERK